MIRWLNDGVTAPQGFSAGGMFCGIKKSKKFDLGILVSDRPCCVSAAFTQNRVKAAPVQHDLKVAKRKTVFGVVVNSGNANACTGTQGMKDAIEMTGLAEGALHLPKGSMLVSSTGVIGHHLPMDI